MRERLTAIALGLSVGATWFAVVYVGWLAGRLFR